MAADKTELPGVWYGYGRGSTDKQIITLQDQRERIERYYNYRERPGTWGGMYEDPATSGSKPFRERKAGGALFARLRQGDHLCVTTLDRAFRNFHDLVNTVEEWMTRGIYLHLLTFGIDTSNIYGSLMLRVMAAFAAFERDLIRERASMAAKYRKKNGGAVNQHPGYGFKLAGHKGKRRVAPDPAERAVMAKIVQLHDEGEQLSFEAIYFEFLRSGFKTKGGKSWSCRRIHRAYCAEMKLREQTAS